jgi:hypothetical protein
VALTVLRRNSPDDVRRFIGDISTTLAAASTTLIAAASAAAVPFAGVTIAADLIRGFPADLNVGFPRSLAFYRRSPSSLSRRSTPLPSEGSSRRRVGCGLRDKDWPATP